VLGGARSGKSAEAELRLAAEADVTYVAAGGPGSAGDEEWAARVDELVGAWRQARGQVVAVSDETGLGVVPHTLAGRMFRDELGRLNQRLAAESEEAVLVVAGRVLSLPG
jgi:adenosylcobinamide kinase/adenosylcobinamide-phosphate guanylyltransferase